MSLSTEYALPDTSKLQSLFLDITGKKQYSDDQNLAKQFWKVFV